jgi:hypothetical protein
MFPWIWAFRIALVITFVLGLIVSTGCTPPTVRVETVHLGKKNTADVALRWKTHALRFVVDVERVVREVDDAGDPVLPRLLNDR